ncbi:MAG: ABC transporter ATP-binding protein [Flavobacteriaceae bacterium]
MILEIDNVELYFKNKAILNGIYLKAETGKVTGILGSNGCGKSCLLQIVFGSLKPKYKLVRIDNKPILKPLYQTGWVKFLPQHALIPKNLSFKHVFKLYEVNWQEFVATFEEFMGCEVYKSKHLSGGQVRLIETYITLKSESKIVLLDEPFSHLAPLHIEKIIDLIEEEKVKKAIIITDHFYNNIIEVSDDIYLFKNGASKFINHLLELEDYKYLSQGSLT